MHKLLLLLFFILFLSCAVYEKYTVFYGTFDYNKETAEKVLAKQFNCKKAKISKPYTVNGMQMIDCECIK